MAQSHSLHVTPWQQPGRHGFKGFTAGALNHARKIPIVIPVSRNSKGTSLFSANGSRFRMALNISTTSAGGGV